jgi:hypothetical protein
MSVPGLSTATIIYKTDKFQTPGPGSYMPPSDFGRAPAWSIKHRYPDKQTGNRAGYEMLSNTVGTGRKYSLSSRHKERDYTRSPGPDYAPPKFGSDAQTSAFHQRIGPWGARDPVGPGPGKYQTRGDGLDGHKFTMKGRNFVRNEGGADGPGGGQYRPDWQRVMKQEPIPAIRERYKDRKLDGTPGPGQYPISRSLANRPASFHARRPDFLTHYGPGPGKYNLRRRPGSAAPAYSLRSRIDVKGDPNTAPYQRLPEAMGNGGPHWSLFIRPKDRDYTQSPGPSYLQPPFGDDGAKWSCRSVNKGARDIGYGNAPLGPGAGKYNTRPAPGGPKWTMKGRQFPPDQQQPPGPGPGMCLPDYSKVLPSDLKGRQILERFKDKKEERPGYYDISGPNRAPKWTIDRHRVTAIRPGCWL